MKAKVAIVGGGVMGTSIALECARRIEDPLKDPVVLLERDRIGAGSSGRSGAILRTIYSDKPLVAMARESLRTYATFQALTGRPIGFRRSGVLTLVGPDQRDWQARLEENVAGMRDMASSSTNSTSRERTCRRHTRRSASSLRPTKPTDPRAD